jgi:hypothetical protein
MSILERLDGAEALPDDAMAHLSDRIAVGEALTGRS